MEAWWLALIVNDINPFARRTHIHQGIIKELDYLGGTLQDAFGVISQTSREEFEALFV